MEKNTIMVYFIAEVILIMIWSPLITWFNDNLPSSVIGDALGSFFWLIMAILFMYFMYKILTELLDF